MQKLWNFFDIVEKALVGIWRNRFLSLSTLFLGVVVLVFLNFILSLEIMAYKSMDELRQKAEFSLWLQEPIDPIQYDFEKQGLINELEPLVAEYREVPAQTIEGLAVELPPSLWIKFDDLAHVSEAFDVLQKLRYAEVLGPWDSDLAHEFLGLSDQILAIQSNLKTLKWTLIVLFSLGGIFLGINAFSAVVFARRQEIEVARLLGASESFVLYPFWVEGAILGFLSAISGISVFVLILRDLAILPGGMIFTMLWNTAFSWQILAAICVGVLGAHLSVRRVLV